MSRLTLPRHKEFCRAVTPGQKVVKMVKIIVSLYLTSLRALSKEPAIRSADTETNENLHNIFALVESVIKIEQAIFSVLNYPTWTIRNRSVINFHHNER